MKIDQDFLVTLYILLKQLSTLADRVKVQIRRSHIVNNVMN